MDKKYMPEASIDIHSLVNSHDKPFVVIDKDYRVVAVNKAYEQKYGVTAERVVGMRCYQVSHGIDHPCSVDGEECPHEFVFSSGESKICAHIHYDADHHSHQVKISAFPLKSSSSELFLGECIEDVQAGDNCTPVQGRMVGASSEFRLCVDRLNIAASSDAPVLLYGETGTGKELAAEYIHQHSSRCHAPFQVIDSTVFSDNLFESEMFGHANGAYTGSVGEKQGLFELADGGTIFLDEIGDLPLSQQAKLLRVLENGQYRRVGGKKKRTVNVRIICATNKDLWGMVSEGKFREDLYYRIVCLNVRLPNLRDRLEDIPLLAQTLLDDINQSMHCRYYLTSGVTERLQAYVYPGNIRELRNILFIAATRCDDHKIDVALIESVLDDLRQLVKPSSVNVNQISLPEIEASPVIETEQSNSDALTLKNLEVQHIRSLLDKYDGNRKKVADALGISERTMYRKLKKLDIR